MSRVNFAAAKMFMNYREERPPNEFEQAIAEFNRQQFFECHETLELLWNAESRDLRLFYQGILQVGVGLYKIRQRPNYRGALSLLKSGVQLLEQFRPELFGVDVEKLIAAAKLVRAELEHLGPENFQQLPSKLIPAI